MYSHKRLSNVAVFSFIFFCLSFFLHTTASPLAETSLQDRDLVKRYSGSPSGKLTDPDNGGDGGPDTSDYQSDDEIAAAYTAPSGALVFFSGIGSSQEPYNFAQTLSPAGAILRGAFPKGFITRGKPQRSAQWFQDFLDRTSGYFADQAVKAGNKVYFVGRFDAVVADCSIWSRIELPTLVAGGIPITLVDYTNFANQKDYPIPDNLLVGDGGIFKKRNSQYCHDWLGNEEDPADPDSTPGVGIGYYPGNCGVHVKQVSQCSYRERPLLTFLQYQKNEGAPDSTGGTSNYRFDILIKDDQGERVGELDYADAPGGQGVNVDSQLPLVLVVTAENVDDDPVEFAYGGQSWDSNSAQCSVGGYDSGARQMDCGFSC